MASLSLFPLDTVKIDRSFVKHLGDHKQTASIIAAIISLSRALNMDVTGEGIETVDHVSYLQSMGCHIGQGYYFAKPMTSTNLTEMIGSGYVMSVQLREAKERELIEKLLCAA